MKKITPNKHLILHAVILKKPAFESKQQALKEAHHLFPSENYKKFVRETKSSFRFRVHPKGHFNKESFVSKKINKDIVLVFGKPNEKLKGGVISSDELQKFIEASYKGLDDAQQIDDYVIDKSLSTKRNKVYYNPTTGKAVHTMSGTDSGSDWLNNLALITGTHKYTNRYKSAEDTQRKANEKYGKENVGLVSHSQSGNIAENFARQGLTGKDNVSLNPAIFGKHHEGLEVVKSDKDLVSALSKTGNKDTLIKSERAWYNPMTYLKEHSPSIIGRTNKLFGGSRYSDYVKAYAKENNLTYRQAQKDPNLKDEWLSLRDEIGEIQHKEKMKAYRLKQKTKKQKEELYYEEQRDKTVKRKAEDIVKNFDIDKLPYYKLRVSLDTLTEKQREAYKKYIYQLNKKIGDLIYGKLGKQINPEEYYINRVKPKRNIKDDIINLIEDINSKQYYIKPIKPNETINDLISNIEKKLKNKKSVKSNKSLKDKILNLIEDINSKQYYIKPIKPNETINDLISNIEKKLKNKKPVQPKEIDKGREIFNRDINKLKEYLKNYNTNTESKLTKEEEEEQELNNRVKNEAYNIVINYDKSDLPLYKRRVVNKNLDNKYKELLKKYIYEKDKKIGDLIYGK
jgi:hypothetical protein